MLHFNVSLIIVGDTELPSFLSDEHFQSLLSEADKVVGTLYCVHTLSEQICYTHTQHSLDSCRCCKTAAELRSAIVQF